MLIARNRSFISQTINDHAAKTTAAKIAALPVQCTTTWISPKRVAEILDVSEATVWRWTKSHVTFPKPVKLSPGCTRFSLEEIQRFVQTASRAPR